MPFLSLGLGSAGKCLATAASHCVSSSSRRSRRRPRGKRTGSTHRQAGDGVMGQRVGAITVVIVAVHIVKEAAHMLAQGIIQDHE